MEVAAKNRIPDDHLGFELGFMACLCDKAQDAASAGSGQKEERLLRSAQQEFLHEHLARWTGDFANKVRAADTCGYYAAWADFAASHVEEDCRLDPL
jgi:TorA maturation chaperone TorD